MTDKIAIERKILEHTVIALEYAYGTDDVLIAESIKFLRHALAGPPSMQPLPNHDNHHNALYAAPQAWRPDIGEVVVTRNDAGEIVAVTRQDDEGRILSVIAEAQPAPAQEPALQEIADFGQEQELVAWLRFQEHENRPTTIHLCDSDHPKAFKVYATMPQPASSQAKSLCGKYETCSHTYSPHPTHQGAA
jgi:hypothetical protein